MKPISFLIVLFLSFNCFVNAQNDYPVLNDIVTDNAKLFSEEELLQLQHKLITYETETTHQIVVLTINNLGNDTVENYAFQTFNLEGNKLGQAAEDNGILILVAKNDRKFRIEVGDGLTPIITDLIASRINRNYITPAFKEGEYYVGIDNATSEIIKIIEDPIYAEEFANSEETSEPVSIVTKFISSIFLTSFFFVMSVLGYNYVTKKRKKSQRINIKKLFLNNKVKFISIWLLLICIATYFNTFFWYAFLAVFVIGFFSTFVGIGFLVIFKGAYKRSVDTFSSLFIGKLGVVIFPFYLPITILLLVAGSMFSFLPLFMLSMFVIDFVSNKSINDVMSGIEPTHLLVCVIVLLLLFFIITAVVAYKKIKKDSRKQFAFSFFKIDTSFLKSIKNSSRGYSSSGSSSYSSSYSSSSSSSSSFSGGGGSSSGGGSSGSW